MSTHRSFLIIYIPEIKWISNASNSMCSIFLIWQPASQPEQALCQHPVAQAANSPLAGYVTAHPAAAPQKLLQPRSHSWIPCEMAQQSWECTAQRDGSVQTPDSAAQSCALSTDASGMLRRGSGLQRGAVLSPGEFLDFRVLCTQTADTAQCPGEMGQERCVCETAI